MLIEPALIDKVARCGEMCVVLIKFSALLRVDILSDKISLSVGSH